MAQSIALNFPLPARHEFVSIKRSRTFSFERSDDLENYLTLICAMVANGIQSIVPSAELEGVMLGGGYGRGEGGLLKTDEGDRPYNDMEFYVLISGHSWINERFHGGSLHRLS